MTANAGGPGLSTTVLITSFRRTERLLQCLDGVRGQAHPADEVIVVVHASDKDTVKAVAQQCDGWPMLRTVIVVDEGSVAALNCGLAAARGEIVAIVDDDAVPTPDWLERLVATYQRDERIAAVGGRDLVIQGGQVVEPPRRRLPGQGANPHDVGRVQWFGRVLANHHIGVGDVRDVDVLKGANMSVRRQAVLEHGYDQRLRGIGAVVHTELSICLPLRRQGYRVVYDPAIVVTHFPAARPHGDHRAGLALVEAASHNEALQILDYFGAFRRVVFAVWCIAIGTTEAPGLLILIRDLVRGRPGARRRFLASQQGRAAAWRTRRRRRRLPNR